MDKLKELLKQLGGSDELISSISEELARYGEELKTQYNEDFNNRIQKARQICLEEVQKEKSALARKVSIFLESKLETIEKAAEKHRLQEDTEAVSKLKRMRAYLEDVQLDDNGQSRELQETKKQLTRLNKAFKTLKEERDTAVNKANQANEIALKALGRNRLLEGKAKESTSLVENKSVAVKGQATPTKVTEPRKALVEERQVPAQSKTTRKHVESQSSKKPNDTRIAGIAAQIEVDD